MVQFKQSSVTAITLGLAVLSLICCSVVAVSIRLDPRGSKSYHLILVQSLLRSDIGLALSIVTYFSVQYHVTGDNLEEFCRAFLPFLVYFFLVSSAWTVMLALRFRSSQNVAAQFNKPPLPMWAVWAIPTAPALVMLAMGLSRTDVTDARTSSKDTNQSCQFDHRSLAGISTDLICFQAPLIVMMLMNVYTYGRGLLALQNAPHSVIARQMRRAGGYLAVLLIVWVPNIAYNLLVICDDSNEPFDNFLVLTVMLSASQGFLNTCVYVYSNRTMMRWLKANLCILRLTGRHEHPSNTRISDNNNNNNSHGQHQAEADAGARPNVESTTDSELDDLDDDSQWLSSNPSLSAPKGVRRLASSTTAPGEEEEVEQEGEGYDEESGQVVNVLVAQQEQGQGGAGSDSSINRKSLGSLHSVKSILIGEKNAKNITKKKTGYFTDVDSEKFVRFGTTETRTISERAASGTRDSEVEMK